MEKIRISSMWFDRMDEFVGMGWGLLGKSASWSALSEAGALIFGEVFSWYLVLLGTWFLHLNHSRLSGVIQIKQPCTCLWKSVTSDSNRTAKLRHFEVPPYPQNSTPATKSLQIRERTTNLKTLATFYPINLNTFPNPPGVRKLLTSDAGK